MRDLSLLETIFEETCTKCDCGPIHYDEQLSRRRKERTQGLNLFVLEEKFLKYIPWEFLPLNETHFYSLYSHHTSLLDLLGMSAQPKYNGGSYVLKQFLLFLQKLGIFQQSIIERQSAPIILGSADGTARRLCTLGSGSLQADMEGEV